MKPTLQAQADFKLHNAALDMVRGGYAQALGSALAASVRQRLVEDQIGEDGRPVRSGGYVTGRMWQGWRVLPSGRGSKAFFGGSSISSKWILAKKLGEMDDAEIRRIQRGGSIKMTWLTKQRGVDKIPIRLPSGKWTVRSTPDTGAQAWEKKGRRREKAPKVRNRIKAASVQWGDGNSDYKNRSFIGPRENETRAALVWTAAFLERNTMKGGADLAHTINAAERHSARMVREIRRRVRG